MKDFFAKLKCLDGFTLKMIAIVTMVIDHTGAILFPYTMWFRMVGRLSFPIFAFFIAEGFARTGNILKYIRRMLIFALLTEPVFDYAFFGGVYFEYQNVMFTFLAALLGLYCMEKVKEGIANETAARFAGFGVIILAAASAEFLHTDYGAFGVMLVYVYYELREHFWKRHFLSSLVQILCETGFSRLSAFSTLPLMLYNGKRGIRMKYLFYAFYPVHLGVLYLIRSGRIL
ncbi:MAG: conjugal transfer protein TraX [Alistipes sp.]|nr:conjugal transfer protein TraX [Alistipes sp.]